MVGNPMLLDEIRRGLTRWSSKVVSFYSVGEKRGGKLNVKGLDTFSWHHFNSSKMWSKGGSTSVPCNHTNNQKSLQYFPCEIKPCFTSVLYFLATFLFFFGRSPMIDSQLPSFAYPRQVSILLREKWCLFVTLSHKCINPVEQRMVLSIIVVTC